MVQPHVSLEAFNHISKMFDVRDLVRHDKYTLDYLRGVQDVVDALRTLTIDNTVFNSLNHATNNNNNNINMEDKNHGLYL